MSTAAFSRHFVTLYEVFIGFWAAIFLLLLVYCVYNGWFHPLSKFPGPRKAAMTPLWIMRCWVSGHYVHSIKALHDKYGPVVRVAPNQLSFCSATSWKDIYAHVPGRKVFNKSSFYEPIPGQVHNIVSETDASIHAAMRKSLSHGFSASALNAQEDRVHYFVNLLIGQIKDNCIEAAGDMVRWYNFATFDIIGELAFGDAFGCLVSGKTHFWIEQIFGGILTQTFLRAFDYFPPLRGLFRSLYKYKLLPKRITAPRRKTWEYARDKMERRLKVDSLRTDFLMKLISEREKNGTSFQTLQSQASALVVAGSETTATSLSAITYYLCRNPKVYDKLAREIRGAFSNYDQITGRSTDSLIYLKAVIEEGLRLYPPIPIGLPRVSPGETVDGYYVPQGNVVFVSGWAATHSGMNFHNPLDFIPERWLDPECQDKKTASQPFLLGSRSCLGRNLAQLELRIILSKIIWTFDFKLLDDNLDWVADSNSYTFWEKPELPVQFQWRLEEKHQI